jgi:transposase
MPIPLRADFDARMMRAAARWSKDGPQARRLLVLAAIYDGASRTEAAKIGGVTLQIVRDWVMKFNAHGPEGLIIASRPDSRRGYRKLSARPRHHEQAEGAIEDFKKAFTRAWTRSGARRASSPPP